MTLHTPRSRRLALRAARTAALGSAAMLAVGTWSALAPHVPSAGAATAASASLIRPTDGSSTSGQDLTSGGSATVFTFKLPTGAACTGDSANGGYRVQSYIVPSDVEPTSLTFGSGGPMKPSGAAGFWQPLFVDATTSPFVDEQTANAETTGGPGRILEPPGLSLEVFADQIPVGAYNVGLACTLGGASATQLDKVWNLRLTLTADAGDTPGGYTWAATSATPTSTTTTSSSTTSTSTSTSSTSTTTTTTVPETDPEVPISTTSVTISATSLAPGSTLTATAPEPCEPPDGATTPTALVGVFLSTGTPAAVATGPVAADGSWTVSVPLPNDLAAGTYAVAAGCFDGPLEDASTAATTDGETLTASAVDDGPAMYLAYKPASLTVTAAGAGETTSSSVPGAAAAGTSDIGSAGSIGSTGTSQTLPFTGSSEVLALWAFLLLVSGRAAVLLAREPAVIAET